MIIWNILDTIYVLEKVLNIVLVDGRLVCTRFSATEAIWKFFFLEN